MKCNLVNSGPPTITWSTPLWAAAAVAIGRGLWLNDGMYDRAALVWVGGGIILAWAGWGLAGRKVQIPEIALGICLALFLFELYEFWNDSPLPEVAAPLGYFTIVVPLFAIAGVGAMCLARWSRAAFVPLLLATQFGYGLWLLQTAKQPPIDVYVVTRDACAAMSRGEDPYAISFPDVFTRTANWETRFYPPEFVYGGRIHFGYQYMPLSFYLAWIGHLLGDFRFASLAAVTAAGALMAYAAPGPFAAAAACLWALAPKNYLVIDRGWAEPAVVLCLALVVFVARRRPAWLPWTVGLLLVSKQHMILAAPAVALLVGRKDARWFWVKAIAVGAVVTLPLVLWNFAAFWKSAIRVQLENPFRPDSLNFAAAWVHAGHAAPAGWISFALALAAAVGCAWRGPRSAAGFAGAVAVIYLSFFALSKQTFCNYYFLTIGALCCAVAAESRAWNKQPAR